MKTVAIVPARGGSKGLPGKNLKLLAGKPLIAYSIEAARESGVADRVIVTTDAPDIAAVGKKYGAEVIDRPAELATDTARSQDAVRHVLDVLRAEGSLPETCLLLQPTSPLRTAVHVREAVTSFRASRAASLMSVTLAEHPPHKALLLGDGKLKPLFSIEDLSRPRQQLPPVYRQNGAIYIVKTDEFLRAGEFFIDPAIPYLMSHEHSFDVDTALDLAICELLLTRHYAAQ